MKDKFIHTLTILFICLIVTSSAIAKEIFNFNVTEVEITQNGNVFKGTKGGEAFTNDGITIKADYFEYNKFDAINLLKAKYNFKPYPYKHYESIFTRFYQGYILPKIRC